MSSRTDHEFLRDIQEGIRRIREYCRTPTALAQDQFRADIRTQNAVIRNLEIIGEATKNLSLELRSKYPDILWRGMAGIRDRLIHHCFGTNLDIVWDIAAVELPKLESQIDMILQREDPE